jgi:hypothetical protein
MYHDNPSAGTNEDFVSEKKNYLEIIDQIRQQA